MRRTTSRIVIALVGTLALGTGTAAATSAEPHSPAASDSAAEGSTDDQLASDREVDPSEDEESGPDIAGRCGDTFHVEIDGAEAYWALHCSHPPNIDRVRGWVKDTRFDAQAASLRFTDSGAILLRHFQARGSGERTTFSFDPQRTDVEGRLQLSW